MLVRQAIFPKAKSFSRHAGKRYASLLLISSIILSRDISDRKSGPRLYPTRTPKLSSFTRILKVMRADILLDARPWTIELDPDQYPEPRPSRLSLPEEPQPEREPSWMLCLRIEGAMVINLLSRSLVNGRRGATSSTVLCSENVYVYVSDIKELAY
ncbi:uncharacterized protein EV420DRAFT_1099963 [Desarmillaria tabescens]|uniref:Uncharacterized protein n=1 Tax=Armillaria tabescens TaxID=1929756 RepID=A0AA39TR51_ARMTA|nr:uncharacterized protein EV420DRAFT_1099963 [Desarmillaria tabescens]KAK0463633.1 hypothetical protein EV420DRAFT_1099963 [Desarmillaria tabescens]